MFDMPCGVIPLMFTVIRMSTKLGNAEAHEFIKIRFIREHSRNMIVAFPYLECSDQRCIAWRIEHRMFQRLKELLKDLHITTIDHLLMIELILLHVSKNLFCRNALLVFKASTTPSASLSVVLMIIKNAFDIAT